MADFHTVVFAGLDVTLLDRHDYDWSPAVAENGGVVTVPRGYFR